MIYGYVRVSTKRQSVERQLKNILAEYPAADTSYQDWYTGTKTEGREAWERLLKKLQSGDTVVFDSVSRMSRNAEEGFATYEDLFSKGINLVFLKEPHINTDTYKAALQNAVPMTGSAVDCILDGINKYLLILAKEQIKLAFEQSEKEVKDLHDRVSEGMKVKGAGAKISQARTGKPVEVKKKQPSKDAIKRYSRDFDGSLKDGEVMKLVGLARNTYYRYKKELFEERYAAHVPAEHREETK